MLLPASGETCGQDASGNATCNGQGISQSATSSAVLQTPTQGDTSVTTPGATTTTSHSTLTSTSSSSSARSTSHSVTSTSPISSRPTTTGTGTTSAHSSSSTSSRGSAVGFVVPQNALTLLGFMASMALFVSHRIDHEDGRLIIK